MSAKLKRYTITMGMNKGKQCTLTKKKAKADHVIVNIIDGPIVELHKSLIKQDNGR